MFVSDPLIQKKKMHGDFFFPELSGTTVLCVGTDTLSVIHCTDSLAQEKSGGHTPLSKTAAHRNDERGLLVRSGWDKLGGKAVYLWVTPCLPDESGQQRCNLSEQSQAGAALPRRGLLQS